MVAPPRLTLHGSAIHIGAGLLSRVGEIVRESAPSTSVVVITDTTVGPLWLATVTEAMARDHPDARVLVQQIPPGEAEKSRRRWAELTDAMLDARCGRDTTVVALGGGVIGDLAGFVAATYMRGVALVQVPTTLLAMVDASIGGKVGVDTRHGKNLVGAFHHPRATVIDPAALGTLPRAHRRAGLAEIIKHGVIADAAHLASARTLAPLMSDAEVMASADDLQRLIGDSVGIKARIVAEDPAERGLRRALNFGHTVGHAIEHVSGYALLHGEAVAIGLVVEARLAVTLGVAAEPLLPAVMEALEAAQLPTTVPEHLETEPLLAAMQIDKKSVAGALRFALPESVGRLTPEGCGIPAPVDAVRSAIARSRSRQ